jgi:CBS domain-containing protein
MNPNRPVSSIMARELVTVKPNDPITHIHNLFEQHSFHHLPVVEQGKLIGIISKADYLKIKHMLSISWDGATMAQEWYAGICARDIMTAGPLCIDSSDSIGLAADIFKANQFHALPVLDDGRLIGILTSHDLLAYAYKEPI